MSKLQKWNATNTNLSWSAKKHPGSWSLLGAVLVTRNNTLAVVSSSSTTQHILLCQRSRTATWSQMIDGLLKIMLSPLLSDVREPPYIKAITNGRQFYGLEDRRRRHCRPPHPDWSDWRRHATFRRFFLRVAVVRFPPHGVFSLL